MSRGHTATAAWVATALFSFVSLSENLAHLVEGRLASALELTTTIAVILCVLASCALTLRWARTPANAASGAPPRTARRSFLIATLGAAGGVGATLAAAIAPNRRWLSVTADDIFLVRPPYKADVARAEWNGARVAGYRRLGRTGAMVSDISLGSGSSTGGRQTADVAREAIERGINYFDTAPDYSEEGSEKRLGEAMQGKRDQMFVATKFCLPNGHLRPGTPVAGYVEAVEGSLRRLRTDWVDLVHIHSCDSVERLLDENAHEAFDRLKQAGKVRFLGVSTHTPNLEEVAGAAIESDRFDVMMVAYHFGAWPNLAAIIDHAAEKDIGVVAMKTLRGSLHHFLEWEPDARDSFTQASFKWVLSNPSVACLVISLWETAQLDEFLYASGRNLRPQDVAVLEKYAELSAAQQCRPHCGACLGACPEGLPIPDILRQRMYFENYGAQKEGMRLYAALEKNAAACVGCAAPCTSACPHGVAVAERVGGAHALLSLR